MTNVALVVEGPGDVDAFPILAVKAGLVFAEHVVAPRPIKAGHYLRLRREGELERYVIMAATRQDVDAVVVAIDLDDGCASEFHAEFDARAAAAAAPFGKAVRVCFCVREFECWFLEEIDHLRASVPEINWDPTYVCLKPTDVRGAKEELQLAMKRHYKETQDQAFLTRRLDLKSLFYRSRSFRKFARCVTGRGYGELYDDLIAV